jgi:hypothetical protein
MKRRRCPSQARPELAGRAPPHDPQRLCHPARAKALPGFQGAWMNDGLGTGTCVVVFDTQRQRPISGIPAHTCGRARCDQ